MARAALRLLSTFHSAISASKKPGVEGVTRPVAHILGVVAFQVEIPRRSRVAFIALVWTKAATPSRCK